MGQDQWLGFLRDMLKLIGSALVTNGVVSGADWTTYSGLAIMIAPLAWSAYERTKTRMIEKVDKLPEVAGVVTRPTAEGKAIAEAITSPTVVPAGTQAAVAVAK